MKSFFSKYGGGILLLLLAVLFLSLPAGYENEVFAKGAFLTAFVSSLAWTILAFYLMSYCRVIKVCFFTIIFILFALETAIYLRFGSRIDANIITLLMQTDWAETREFIAAYLLNWKTLCTFLCIIGVYCLLIHVIKKIHIKCLIQSKLYRALSLPVLIIGLALPYLSIPTTMGKNPIVGICDAIQFVRNSHDDVDQFVSMIDKIEIYSDSCKHQSPTIVLVIGESFNKHRSSLYGYALPTNPLLSKEKNLVLFTQAKTPVCYTSGAMRYIFSLKSCDLGGADSAQYVLFPAVFRKASFKVAYFDNQYTRSRGGEADYGCSYFFSPKYINDHCFDLRNETLEEFDGDFISTYKSQFLKNGASLNLIHLKGQHFQAMRRYPLDFAYFTVGDIQRNDLDDSEKQRMVEYDNATRYNDYVMRMILDEFRNDDAVVIYFSDHGENIFDGKGHRYGRNIGELSDEESAYNVRQIPFMIWCSDTFIHHRPEMYHAIRQASELPVCIDDVAYLLFDLGYIDFNYHQPERSLVNSQYHPHQTAME